MLRRQEDTLSALMGFPNQIGGERQLKHEILKCSYLIFLHYYYYYADHDQSYPFTMFFALPALTIRIIHLLILYLVFPSTLQGLKTIETSYKVHSIENI